MVKNKRRDYIVVALLLVIGFLLLMGVLIYRVCTNGAAIPAAPVGSSVESAEDEADSGTGWFESLKNELFGIDEGGAPEEDLESSAPATGAVIPTSYGEIPLTSDQVKMIEGLGVEVESLPEKITPELEDCVRSRLGEERIREIIESGDFGAFDALNVAPCF